MSELMLVNPRRKRRRRPMSALQRKYFGKKNPRRRHRRAAATTTHRRRRRRVSVRARRNPRAVSVVARRNPRRRRRAMAGGGALSVSAIRSGGILKSTVLPAAIGAGGAIALDAMYALLPIPATLKAGTFAAPVKAAAVLGIGVLASRFMPRQRRLIQEAVAASLTIQSYNFVKAQVQKMFPALKLAEYINGYDPMLAEYVQAGQFLPDIGSGVGEYISGAGIATNLAWDDSIYGDAVF